MAPGPSIVPCASAGPRTELPGDILALQRLYGNRAVVNLLAGAARPTPTPTTAGPASIQPKRDRTARRSLDETVRSDMEQAFQQDFSEVEILEDARASEVGALAYTQGEEIHFAPGRYNPSIRAGRERIGHELAHVVQQRQGRVKATGRSAGLPVNHEPALESEASALGRRAAQGEPASRNGFRLAARPTSSQAPIQCIKRYQELGLKKKTQLIEWVYQNGSKSPAQTHDLLKGWNEDHPAELIQVSDFGANWMKKNTWLDPSQFALSTPGPTPSQTPTDVSNANPTTPPAPASILPPQPATLPGLSPTPHAPATTPTSVTAHPPPSLTLELWGHIMNVGSLSGILSRPDIGHLKQVSKTFNALASDQGVPGEIWYGQDSAVLNQRTFFGESARRPPGNASYQEGPCGPKARAVVQALQDHGLSVPSMVGVVLGVSGTYYVTLSGSKSQKLDQDSQAKGLTLPLAAKEVFEGQPYRVVQAGKVGRLTDADGEDEVTLKGSTAKNFKGQSLPKDYPKQATEFEEPNAPPGTCALPILLDACRDYGDAPVFMSEKRFDPSGKNPVNVLGPSGEVEQFEHEETTPSCLHCRDLTPDQLVGAREKEASNRHNRVALATMERFRHQEALEKAEWEKQQQKEQKSRQKDESFGRQQGAKSQQAKTGQVAQLVNEKLNELKILDQLKKYKKKIKQSALANLGLSLETITVDHIRGFLLDAKTIRNDASAIDVLDTMSSSTIAEAVIGAINLNAG